MYGGVGCGEVSGRCRDPLSIACRSERLVPLTMDMRALFFLPLLSWASAAAQFPLPFWEAFDSARVVLSQLPEQGPPDPRRRPGSPPISAPAMPRPHITAREAPGTAHPAPPDTLWANGVIPVPIISFDTVVVDQCCLDPDPSILLARLPRWPKNTSGELLPLFTERLDADTAAWFLMGEWRAMPDTMIPLTAHPNSLVRYFWNTEGLETQTQDYGTWRFNSQHHLKRSACTVQARDSLKLMRCAPHSAYRSIEPAVLLFFIKHRLVEVFQDNRGTGIDGWGYFDRAGRSSAITARHGDEQAIILSSGEVLTWRPERWKLIYREPSIYRGECDCE